MADEKLAMLPLKEEQVNSPRPTSRKSSWSWARVALFFLAVIAGARIERLFIHGRIQYGHHHHSEPESQPDGWTEWSDVSSPKYVTRLPAYVASIDIAIIRVY